MAKYIDAELLRKEIEFAKSVYSNPNRVVHGVADAFRQDGRVAMCDDILKKIDSLQRKQEQYIIGGQVFGATDIEQLYEGKVYIISNLVQDIEFGIEPREQVKMLLIKD